MDCQLQQPQVVKHHLNNDIHFNHNQKKRMIYREGLYEYPRNKFLMGEQQKHLYLIDKRSKHF